MKALIALLFSTLFLAACGTVPAHEKPDVARVISITDTQEACGIVPVTMVYEDSQARQHELHYQVWANGCSGS
ncbi:DUF2790 domain-containing protein [Pseudomonas sp. PDM23]|uniref:DUF2790 domain-containing protein n=1 Tax=unclassified Pseudomonas TaxID=196821 RepID=UPI0017869DC2|nr:MULTISPECIES: DUF2790 domain-containing protein [unclassified Pseudomonas]MBD9576825.1 DUF2790 domain-containing protein [Pseudomonas sp. PDM23]MBD9670752.1 DUF2790 domain-containing protein [Pseudomonas sp. PDM21]